MKRLASNRLQAIPTYNKITPKVLFFLSYFCIYCWCSSSDLQKICETLLHLNSHCKIWTLPVNYIFLVYLCHINQGVIHTNACFSILWELDKLLKLISIVITQCKLPLFLIVLSSNSLVNFVCISPSSNTISTNNKCFFFIIFLLKCFH